MRLNPNIRTLETQKVGSSIPSGWLLDEHRRQLPEVEVAQRSCCVQFGPFHSEFQRVVRGLGPSETKGRRENRRPGGNRCNAVKLLGPRRPARLDPDQISDAAVVPSLPPGRSGPAQCIRHPRRVPGRLRAQRVQPTGSKGGSRSDLTASSGSDGGGAGLAHRRGNGVQPALSTFWPSLSSALPGKPTNCAA
jgi:hypothetical protein